MAVVGAAQEHRVLAGVGEAVAQREGRADPAGAAQRGQAAQRRCRLKAWAKLCRGEPQVQADAQVAGAVPGR